MTGQELIDQLHRQVSSRAPSRRYRRHVRRRAGERQLPAVIDDPPAYPSPGALYAVAPSFHRRVVIFGRYRVGNDIVGRDRLRFDRRLNVRIGRVEGQRHVLGCCATAGKRDE
jgi:hypothetical protein